MSNEIMRNKTCLICLVALLLFPSAWYFWPSVKKLQMDLPTDKTSVISLFDISLDDSISSLGTGSCTYSVYDLGYGRRLCFIINARFTREGFVKCEVEDISIYYFGLY